MGLFSEAPISQAGELKKKTNQNTESLEDSSTMLPKQSRPAATYQTPLAALS